MEKVDKEDIIMKLLEKTDDLSEARFDVEVHIIDVEGATHGVVGVG